MHRLHTTPPVHKVNVMPPSGERAAITQKLAKEAPHRKGQEEVHRMGDALAHAKHKDTPSIK
mgnify:CR=1 FL=1|jgi:hypothetical protein